MDKAELLLRAQMLGFERVRIIPPLPFRYWREQAEGLSDGRVQGLEWNPMNLLPGAKSLIVLVMPYTPYAGRPDEVYLHPYYPASNAAHAGCLQLGQWLNERGFKTLAAPALPHKSSAARAKLGRYGRNGLISVPPFGTRVCLQLLLSEAPLALDDFDEGEEMPLDTACESCGLCKALCPTGALNGSGRLEIGRCLRGVLTAQPVPEAYRPLMGNSLMGCDLCQARCPRNPSMDEREMPQDLRRALDLKALLMGQVKPLWPFLGKNNARPARTQAQAALIAANLNRRDLIPLIEPLTAHFMPLVKEHALWALNRLTERANRN